MKKKKNSLADGLKLLVLAAIIWLISTVFTLSGSTIAFTGIGNQTMLAGVVFIIIYFVYHLFGEG